jgi:hypothetical protein
MGFFIWAIADFHFRTIGRGKAKNGFFRTTTNYAGTHEKSVHELKEEPNERH